MSLRGTIRNGRVELDAETSLPDGTRVDIEPSGAESLLELVRRHSIDDPSAPKDLAANLDHYLYGTPKRVKAGRPKIAVGGGPAAKRRKRTRHDP